MADRHRVQRDLDLAHAGRGDQNVLDDQRRTKCPAHGSLDGLHVIPRSFEDTVARYGPTCKAEYVTEVSLSCQIENEPQTGQPAGEKNAATSQNPIET